MARNSAGTTSAPLRARVCQQLPLRLACLLPPLSTCRSLCRAALSTHTPLLRERSESQQSPGIEVWMSQHCAGGARVALCFSRGLEARAVQHDGVWRRLAFTAHSASGMRLSSHTRSLGRCADQRHEYKPEPQGATAPSTAAASTRWTRRTLSSRGGRNCRSGDGRSRIAR